MRKVVWLAGLMALALAACNTPFNPDLLPGVLAGTWIGPISSAGTSLGTLTLKLVPNPDSGPITTQNQAAWTASGTWRMALSSVADSGTVAAKGSGAIASMAFALTSASGCSLNLTGIRFGAASIIGTYTALSCAVPDSGSFSVTKQ